jgi:hypothetical protein
LEKSTCVAGFYESGVTFIFHFAENVTVAARPESAKRIKALDLRGKQRPCCNVLRAIVAAAILESISLPSAPHGIFVNCSRRPRFLTSAVLDTGRTCIGGGVQVGGAFQAMLVQNSQKCG